MNLFVMIIFMVVIGAIIGGSTNALAIKMLFRPYNAIYIGNWRLPFTPGLIPKRRDELAKQLGNMVVNHLLTAESIQAKILNESFQHETTAILQKEVKKLLNSEESLEQFLQRLGWKDSREQLKDKVDSIVEKKYDLLMNKYRQLPMKELLSARLLEKIDDKIPLISTYILEKAANFFASSEGEKQIGELLDQFVKGRSGMLGNMLQMVVGNVNLTDKLQKEILKFIHSEGAHHLVTGLLEKERDKMLEWSAETIEEQLGRDQIMTYLKSFVQRVANIDNIFASSISELTHAYKGDIVERLIPRGVQMFSNEISSRVELIMEKLHLADLVREQVEAFPVERLEEMVLAISRRELKLITYLGGLLGGLIGLFQGILTYFLT